ncbi:MAG: hypothetical protein LBK66_09765 [Spirochaetaceae bacterium]|jgi:hypothetical protein|nr:hypothetical protein [Spirochaetaceae bacterium]
MSQDFDFYETLCNYSRKLNSPYIVTETLINVLQRNAMLQDKENKQSALKQWLGDNIHEKIFAELERLSDEQKCIIQGEAPHQRILLPNFFIERLEQLYLSIESSNSRPFPDESYFRTKIPAGLIKEISVENGLIDYLGTPQQSILPIIKLVFPENFGHALVLSTQIPKCLLEASILKLKYSMQSTKTLVFYQQKLTAHFPGQEPNVKRFIKNLTQNQSDCIEDLIESKDFTFSSWIFLYPLIKMHVKDTIVRDDGISPESMALYQSITLLQSFNNYYKVAAISKHNKMLSFSAVYERMADPPYMYTFNSLMKLNKPGGVLILQRYTENDLKEWLNYKTISDNEKLPYLFKFRIPNDDDFFVRKDKVFTLCASLLKDLRPKVKMEITNRWTKLLGDYYKEKAMENDLDFESLITKISKLYAPALMSIINSPKFDILQQGVIEEGIESPKNVACFVNGEILPLRTLLDLKRADLLLYCRLSLPFWHSIPFIVAIGRILKHKSNNAYYTEADKQLETDASLYLKQSARKIINEIVPDNTNPDDYMKSMLNRWNRLINKVSKDRLTHDVDIAIKNGKQYIDKMLKRRILTQSMLNETAESIIHSNAVLARISNKNALRIYIKLSITKTLLE